MAKYDRIEHLKTIHAHRKANTHQKVDDAIKRLIRANKRTTGVTNENLIVFGY